MPRTIELYTPAERMPEGTSPVVFLAKGEETGEPLWLAGHYYHGSQWWDTSDRYVFETKDIVEWGYLTDE